MEPTRSKDPQKGYAELPGDEDQYQTISLYPSNPSDKKKEKKEEENKVDKTAFLALKSLEFNSPPTQTKTGFFKFFSSNVSSKKAEVKEENNNTLLSSPKDKFYTDGLLLEVKKIEEVLEKEIPEISTDPNIFLREDTSPIIKAVHKYVDDHCLKWLDRMLIENKKMNHLFDKLSVEFSQEFEKISEDIKKEVKKKYGELLFPAFVASLKANLNTINPGLKQILISLLTRAKEKFVAEEEKINWSSRIFTAITLRIFIPRFILLISDKFKKGDEAKYRRYILGGMMEHISSLEDLPEDLKPLFSK